MENQSASKSPSHPACTGIKIVAVESFIGQTRKLRRGKQCFSPHASLKVCERRSSSFCRGLYC